MTTPYYHRFTNAFASKKKENYEVWISQNMFDILEEKEILSVIAHEIGHHIKKHHFKLKILMMMQFTYYLAIAMVVFTRNDLYISFGYERVSSALAIIIIVTLFGFFNRFFMLLNNYISRKFENEADHYSTSINGNGHLISALIKIYQFTQLSPYVNPIDEFVNYPHPNLYNRIKAIQSENN
jgi:STE24 endopeptidase